MLAIPYSSFIFVHSHFIYHNISNWRIQTRSATCPSNEIPLQVTNPPYPLNLSQPLSLSLSDSHNSTPVYNQILLNLSLSDSQTLSFSANKHYSPNSSMQIPWPWIRKMTPPPFLSPAVLPMDVLKRPKWGRRRRVPSSSSYASDPTMLCSPAWYRWFPHPLRHRIVNWMW